MPDQNDIVFSQHTLDIGTLLRAIAEVIHTITGGGVEAASVVAFLETLWLVAAIILFLLAALFLFGFVYASIRFNQLAEIEAEQVKRLEELYQELYGTGVKNDRLADVEAHISTDNPNDWKLAIIEADIILGQILDQAGYAGATIGEQLKSASAHAFQTLDDAWEAHKVRNQIAHEGADFVLTKKLARETITRYKRVFAEFGEG